MGSGLESELGILMMAIGQKEAMSRKTWQSAARSWMSSPLLKREHAARVRSDGFAKTSDESPSHVAMPMLPDRRLACLGSLARADGGMHSARIVVGARRPLC